VRKTLRTILLSIATISALFATFFLVQPASATVEWVSAPTWKNLHAKIEDGVFERVKREFDTASNLMVDSETQHNIAWVRTDRNSVTVRYQGGLTNANKKVQFVIDGDVPFTSSLGGSVAIGETIKPEAITDGTGVAEVTLTLNQTPVAENDLRVGLSSGDVGSEQTVGNLVLDWQDPGFFPVIKLIGSGSGFTSQCLYRSPNAQGVVQRAHECTNGDFQEFTWAWSVFKKDWLPEYSQVYVKSYKYGSTINLTYKVTDIWGSIQVDRDVHLTVDSGCRLCKWATFEPDQATDSNGLVSFSVRNRNTFKDVRNNRFVNSDTKAHEGGFIAFSIQPTTNALDESADFIWPQLVTDVNIKSSASTLSTISRGGNPVNASGDYVTTVNNVQVTNPPLTLDTTDSNVNDIDVVNLMITYMKNSIPIALYSPDIKVIADNGGKAAIADTLRPVGNLTSESSFQSTLVFSYTYPQKIALMCTKTGLTTFKIYTGTTFKTHTMSCKNQTSDARNIAANTAPIAVPSLPAIAVFKVTDKWGNPVADVPVQFSTTGTGSLSNTNSVLTNEYGEASVEVNATEAGAQQVTATVQDESHVTQISQGTSTASMTVNWGTPAIEATAQSKAILFTFSNLAGQRALILEGKSKTYVQVTLGQQTLLKKYTKGRHVLKITAGQTVRTVTVVVP
jgi:hypothetical protein